MNSNLQNRTARRFEFGISATDVRSSDRVVPNRPFEAGHTLTKSKKPLQVMKFGGTSVGDASCIARVADIVLTASRARSLVIVVSAMNGATNRLLEAAEYAALGDCDGISSVLDALHKQHYSAINALFTSATARDAISRQLGEVFREADRLCSHVVLSHQLTFPTRDSILSLGERLSAPLVAAVLAERGLASCAVDATSLIVTNSCHGNADPIMESTRERCEAQLLPLLKNSVVPVVTGFVGATDSGTLTTLGRGGSDYSATILGASLCADEVVIWTDVNGVLTADPRLVSETCTIPEISYHEAADLAYFGAKVLHPKTLRPVSQSLVPVWIRNTFAPELPGTKITATATPAEQCVRALASITGIALIKVAGPGLVRVPNALGRTFTTTAATRADVLLISQSSSQSDICFAVPSSSAAELVAALCKEFTQELGREAAEHVSVDTAVAMVALVGQNVGAAPELVGRIMTALGREGLRIIAVAQGSSGSNISFVVAEKDMKAALVAAHREFRLEATDICTLPTAHEPGVTLAPTSR